MRLFLLTVTLVVLLFSPVSLCAQQGEGFVGASNTMLAEASYQRGVELYRSGRLPDALNLFRGFVIRHYDSPLLDQSLLFLSRILMDLERYEDSLLYVDRIAEEKRNTEADFIKGISLVETGQTEKGVEMLAKLLNAPLFDNDRTRLYRALSTGKGNLGKPMEALYFSSLLAKQEAYEKKSLEAAHLLLKEALDEDDLEEAAFMFSGNPVGLDALTQLAWKVFLRGEEETATRLINTVLADPSHFPFRSDATLLVDRMTGNSWLQADTIGVILPLSGKYVHFGESMKKGLELALSLHNSFSDRQMRFIYKDSKADPELSMKAVSELANDDRAIAIIGPLSGNAAEAAARQAEQEGIPMITLSHRDGLPETGKNIFRNSLTSNLQVKSIAEYATNILGLTSFAVLYPDSSFGTSMRDDFSAEVKKRGGLVVESLSYVKNSTDFGKQIKTFLSPKEEESDKEFTDEEILEDLFVPEEPPMPRTVFSAIFIPEYPKTASLILPQLQYHELDNVQVFGMNTWNSPQFLKMANKSADGVIFPDGFFLHSEYPFVKEFVSLYYETYQEDPAFLQAQSFDVANLLLSILSTGEVRTREAVRNSIQGTMNYPGVTGATSFSPVGDAEKSLFMLQVKNGTVEQLMDQ